MSEMVSAAMAHKGRLRLALWLVSIFVVAEVAGAMLTRSLALLADAGHMLTDAGALALSLIAIRFSERPATPEKTYGYHRLEILAALINAVLLILISFYILIEAWSRLHNPPQVLGGPMLVIAIAALGVNLISMRLLAHGSHESLNVRGAYLEALSDMLVSIGVIAAAIIIAFTGWYLADPIISAAIGLFILPRTWILLKEAVHVLMEGTPSHLNLVSLRQSIEKVHGVKEVHDLHVWTITSGVDAMSAHVTVEDAAQGDRILGELQKLLKENFRVDHTTIQLELQRCEDEGCGPEAG
jgi:cobalt-zinc-cadmium efflux system protein